MYLLLCVLMVCSGCAALVYEMSWARQFGLLIGNTVNSAALVLCGYFGGMALGYFLASKVCHRFKRPIIGYGIAEVMIGLWVLTVPVALSVIQLPFFSDFINHPNPAAQTFFRALCCLLTLMPATIGLGASLPFASLQIEKTYGQTSFKVSFLYGLNTLGACLGCLAAVFVLFVSIGVVKSGMLAALVSLVCGIVAIWVGSNLIPGEGDQGRVAKGSDGAKSILEKRFHIIAFFSGFSALMLQVLTNKMFSLVTYNSSYGLGTVVTVFLLTLSLSAIIVARFPRIMVNSVTLIGMCVGSCFAISLVPLLFVEKTRVSINGNFDDPDLYLGNLVKLSVWLVIPPVLFSGAILPLIWKLSEGLRANIGEVVGRITFANTLGAALGALVAGYFVIPTVGLWGGFSLCALLLAFLILIVPGARSVKYPTFVISVCGVGAFWLYYSQNLERLRSDGLVERMNSQYGWIDVVDRGDSLFINQDLNYIIGGSPKKHANPPDLAMVDVPVLLHSDPKSVALIGAGTGIPGGALGDHKYLETRDVVELVPEVIDATRYFSEVNKNFLGNDQINKIVNDGRNHLLVNPGRYDVVVSNLFVPWHHKAGYLFSRDFYEISRRSLREKGIFCQWLPVWQLRTNELSMILDTISRSFPNTSLWFGHFYPDQPLIGVVASMEKIHVNVDALDHRIGSMGGREDLGRIQSAADLFKLYSGDFTGPGGHLVNTDEHPRLEFFLGWDRGQLVTDDFLKYYEKHLFYSPMKNVVFNRFSNSQQWLMENRQHQVLSFMGKTNAERREIARQLASEYVQKFW